MKFILKCIQDDDHEITSEFNEVTLPEIMTSVGFFLKGLGFSDRAVDEYVAGDDMCLDCPRVKEEE